MSDNDLRVVVEVWRGLDMYRRYVINHDDPVQRRVLGEQCRNALEGGDKIITYAPECMNVRAA